MLLFLSFISFFVYFLILIVGGDIISLDDVTLEKTLSSNLTSPLVVLFYMPWCIWCQRFMPKFEQIEKLIQPALSPYFDDSSHWPLIAKIDLMGKSKVAAKHGVYSFPTIRLYRKSTENSTETESVEFDGRMEVVNLLKWITDQTLTSFTVKNVQNLKIILENHHIDEIVLFNNPPDSPKFNNVWIKLHKHFDNVLFLVTRSSEVSEHVRTSYDFSELPKMPDVILFNPHFYDSDVTKWAPKSSKDLPKEHLVHGFPIIDPNEKRTPSIWTKREDDLYEVLSKFIITNMNALVNRYRVEEFDRLFKMSGLPLFICFVDGKSLDDEDSIATDRLSAMAINLHQIGKKFRSRAIMVVAGTERPDEQMLRVGLHVDKQQVPFGILVTVVERGDTFRPLLRYLAPEGVFESLFRRNGVFEFNKWMESALNGETEPSVKSEETPSIDAIEASKPVVLLTGRTFVSATGNRGTSYVVNMFAPWCGHCRLYEPLYQSMARAFEMAGIKNVIFMKIDATANEVPGVHTHGYPTTLIFKAGRTSKELSPRLHEGSFDTAAKFLDWLIVESGVKFDRNLILEKLRIDNEGGDVPELDEEL